MAGAVLDDAGLGDRLDVFSADANEWFWNVESAFSTPLQALAAGLSGSLDLLHAGNKKVPVFALDAAPVIRAYRRGIRVQAPLRSALRLDVTIQVTATFAP